jgi:hypothetical protein
LPPWGDANANCCEVCFSPQRSCCPKYTCPCRTLWRLTPRTVWACSRPCFLCTCIWDETTPSFPRLSLLDLRNSGPQSTSFLPSRSGSSVAVVLFCVCCSAVRWLPCPFPCLFFLLCACSTTYCCLTSNLPAAHPSIKALRRLLVSCVFLLQYALGSTSLFVFPYVFPYKNLKDLQGVQSYRHDSSRFPSCCGTWHRNAKQSPVDNRRA